VAGGKKKKGRRPPHANRAHTPPINDRHRSDVTRTIVSVSMAGRSRPQVGKARQNGRFTEEETSNVRLGLKCSAHDPASCSTTRYERENASSPSPPGVFQSEKNRFRIRTCVPGELTASRGRGLPRPRRPVTQNQKGYVKKIKKQSEISSSVGVCTRVYDNNKYISRLAIKHNMFTTRSIGVCDVYLLSLLLSPYTCARTPTDAACNPGDLQFFKNIFKHIRVCARVMCVYAFFALCVCVCVCVAFRLAFPEGTITRHKGRAGGGNKRFVTRKAFAGAV